jgi:lysophospholipase L1-like esterase
MEPQSRTLTIAAMGDSTTAGTPGWKSPIEAPPNGEGDERSQYAYWLMRAHPNWIVLNRGVNGERSDQILARFDRHVMDAKPAAVVIIAGVNDIYQGREPAHVTRQLDAMYSRARAGNIPVVAGSIIPYNTATAEQNRRMHEVNAWIKAQPHVHVVDTRRAVASSGSPDLLADTPDGLHPSAEGYRLMAVAIEPVLVHVLGVAALDARDFHLDPAENGDKSP